MRGKDDSEVKPPSEPAPRKRYRTPKLERLGTLTEITAAVGNSGKNDMAGGPPPPNRKTS
jgi:hypothetical protein